MCGLLPCPYLDCSRNVDHSGISRTRDLSYPQIWGSWGSNGEYVLAKKRAIPQVDEVRVWASAGRIGADVIAITLGLLAPALSLLFSSRQRDLDSAKSYP